jgi:predicted amidophosphoribosyltransferase
LLRNRRALLASAAAMLVPPRCALCAAACPVGSPLCDGCEAAITASPACELPIAGLDGAFSAALYEGRARELVAALKFAGRLTLARRAAAEIVARMTGLDGTLVPVPPTSMRARWRGFDPAASIAAVIAAATGLPLRPCLIRLDRRRQVGRPRRERLAEPPVVRLCGPAPERALLVDDVVTTGATLAACARALRGGGGREVIAVTFARAS